MLFYQFKFKSANHKFYSKSYYLAKKVLKKCSFKKNKLVAIGCAKIQKYGNKKIKIDFFNSDWLLDKNKLKFTSKEFGENLT